MCSHFHPNRRLTRPQLTMCCGDSFGSVPILAWMAIWPLLLLIVVWFVKGEHDQPVRYRVPSPKVPEPEEILQKPSIKVRLLLLGHGMDTAAHESLPGLRRQCNPVLRPSHRPFPRFHQPLEPGRHRPSR
jgi:hypothetical protein